MKPIDFAVIRARQLLTVGEGRNGPRRGAEQRHIDVISNGALVASGGRIVAVGPSAEIERDYDLSAAHVIDAAGRVVMPGLVDCHTHPVFAGLRCEEYAELLAGASKQEVVQRGGGIWHTVTETRAASQAELERLLTGYLQRMVRGGTTTVEAKSGYGLTAETELLHLELLQRAADRLPLRIVPTFLGAHIVPRDQTAAAYASEIVDNILPRVAAQGIARFNDVSTSPTTFPQPLASLMVGRGVELGLPARIHTDGGVSSGGWRFAAEHGAISADHLTFTPDEEIDAVGPTPTVATLIPPAELYYRTARRANARRFIEAGVAVAIATDFCSSIHYATLYHCIAFAAAWYVMTPEEVIASVTVNAAYALGMGTEVGTLAPGKFADLVVLDFADYRMLAFAMAASSIEQVAIGGQVVYSNGAS